MNAGHQFGILALISLTAFAFGQASAEKPSPTDDPHRQIDFWVGDWECRTRKGQLAGTNEITLECGGKVLQEHWKGARGGVGTSLNIYDARREVWHQTWVDQSGTLLLLDGNLDEDGDMVLEGTRPGPDGSEVLHRIRWAPSESGVRQTWTFSKDEGESWQTLADLDYVRAQKSPAKDEEEGE